MAIITMPILAIGTRLLGSGTKSPAAGSTMTTIRQALSVVAVQIGKTHQVSVVAQVPRLTAMANAASLGRGYQIGPS
jgi:hypothetical protein